MVEDIFEIASGLLNLEGEGDIVLVKITISQLWMLSFINFDQESENFYSLCNDLKIELLELTEKLTVSVKADVSENLRRIGRLFYRVFLYKLQLSESCLEEVLIDADPLKIKSFMNLLERSFDLFIKNNNDYNFFTNFYEHLLDLLEIYGFKRSVYIEMMILDFMNFEIPFKTLKEAVISTNTGDFIDLNRLEEEDPGITNDCLTSKKVISLIFEEIFNKKSGVPPLAIVKDILRDSCINIAFPALVISELVNYFFSTIGKFYEEHKVNSILYKFEREHNEELSSSSLDQRLLDLQFLRPKTAAPSALYEAGAVLTFHPFGFKDSSRLVYDRLVRFGRFSGECSENDVFLHEKFSTFNTLIICASAGYYLSDVSVEGYFFRNLEGNEKVSVKEGSIFQLGPEMVLAINKIDRETDLVKIIVKVRVIKGGGLAGAYLYCVLEPACPKINVGRDPNSKGLVILDCTNKVSANHCFLGLDGNDVYLQAIEGKKTYINLKNLEQVLNRVPSDFYRIDKEENFLANEVLFKFVPKG